MSKELYLQAIEALRQRVEAAGDEEIEAIEEEFPVSDFVELFDGSIDDYIGFKIDNENEVEPDEALDIILGEAETWLLAAVFKLAWLKHNRNQLKQEIVEALANPADWVAEAERPTEATEPASHAATYAAERAAAVGEATDSRPDAPGADVWDWVAVGSDDVFWEDEDPDGFVDGDDPDWADEYGDGDEDE
jgi:hypothetical protein